MQFNPLPLSSGSLDELRRTTDDNLRLLAETLNSQVQQVQFQPLAVAPTKPREGWVAYANGTNWNPGAGAGVYEYRAGAWVKL